jgi:mannose-6-phosphate isomerase-like protein (cupin superfamily)
VAAVPHVRAGDVAGTRAPAPNPRTLKHLVAPWTLGSEHLWVGLSEIDVGSSSNRHSHENEEVFFVLSGRGSAEVAGASQEVEAGSAVLVPSGQPHRLVNHGDEPLRVLCCAGPAFDRQAFDQAHLLAS